VNKTRNTIKTNAAPASRAASRVAAREGVSGLGVARVERRAVRGRANRIVRARGAHVARRARRAAHVARRARGERARVARSRSRATNSTTFREPHSASSSIDAHGAGIATTTRARGAFGASCC
jgi:hypothetical protein